MRRLLLILPGLLLLAMPVQAQSGGCGSCVSCPSAGGSSAVMGNLDVQLRTLAGDTYDLASRVGTAPIMLFHLGSDSFSDAAASLVQKTAIENPDVVTLAVVCDTSAKARKYVKALKLSFPVLIDPNGEQLALCQPTQCTPSAAFINSSGKVVLNVTEVTRETMKQGLEALTSITRVRDPVCGMTIDAGAAAGSAVYEGKTYYFCSAACQGRFEKNPKQYTAGE